MDIQKVKIGSDIRKFFINTIFDATFAILGIISGLAFVADPEIKIILLTSATSSFALGISSAISVYEAETIEGEKKLADLESAMLTKLEDTSHFKSIYRNALLAAIIVFVTPLSSAIILISPFMLTTLGLLSVKIAAWVSIVLAVSIIFFVGVYMSRNTRGNNILKGARMAFFGVGAFLISIWMRLLIG